MDKSLANSIAISTVWTILIFNFIPKTEKRHCSQFELNKKRKKKQKIGKKRSDGPRTRFPHTKVKAPSIGPRNNFFQTVITLNFIPGVCFGQFGE